MKTLFQKLAAAAGAIILSGGLAAATQGQHAIAAPNSGAGNDLTGVWEALGVPPEVDCVTGKPIGPLINVSYTFHQGGTMYQEDTLGKDRNRTTGSGLWKRTTGRSYTYIFFHYAFDATGTYLFKVRGRSNLVLSADNNSLTEQGTFELVEQNGNVIYSGCFNGTSNRVTF
jgi:hypothetical protein